MTYFFQAAFIQLLLMQISQWTGTANAVDVMPTIVQCSGGDLPPIYAGVNQLVLTAENATQCQLKVATSRGRWYITCTGCADGDIFLQDTGSSNSDAMTLSSRHMSRAMTASSQFQLSVSLRRGRLNVTAILIGATDCPPKYDGWLAIFGSGGVWCLLVAETSNVLAFVDAQNACHRVGANLFTTSCEDRPPWALKSLLNSGRLHHAIGYWVGGRKVASDWVYLNGSILADSFSALLPYKYDCGYSDTLCQCALYRQDQLYQTTCSDLRPFICLAPPGGAPVSFSATGMPCQDCHAGCASAARRNLPNPMVDPNDHLYFYVLGVCALIITFITGAVIACFADSVRRWRQDARRMVSRLPAYTRRHWPLQTALQSFPEPVDEPPVYSNPADVEEEAQEPAV